MGETMTTPERAREALEALEDYSDEYGMAGMKKSIETIRSFLKERAEQHQGEPNV